MKLRIVNTSVVVRGQDYNPSILNPDFLKSEKIVDEDWELSEQPLSTPVVSLVKFANGIVFVTEIGKVQVQDNKPPEDLYTSEVPALTRRYIGKLKYIRHTAVGINVTGFVDHSAAGNFLIEKFLQPGNWRHENLEGVNLKLVYSLPEASLNITLDRGTVTFADEEINRNGILLNANYHIDTTGDSLESTLREVDTAISRASEYYEHFFDIMKTIFDLED
jgi:hypothetical protein